MSCSTPLSQDPLHLPVNLVPLPIKDGEPPAEKRTSLLSTEKGREEIAVNGNNHKPSLWASFVSILLFDDVSREVIITSISQIKKLRPCEAKCLI